MLRPAIGKEFLRGIGTSSPNKKKNKNRDLRSKLLEEDPYCYYCGCPLTLDDSTLDHALPRSKGGTRQYHNVVLACRQCNEGKGDKIIVVWSKQ